MKSTIVKIALISLALPALTWAQAGQAGLSFLKLGVGARSLALGETAVASADDPSAVHYNPAAMRLVNRPQVLIMHKAWIQGTSTEFLAASIPLDAWSIGIQLNATSVPDIEIRQRAGPPEGTFAARNAAIGASAAYSIDSTIAVGLSTNLIYEKILVDETSGIAFGLGGIYRSPWDMTFGLSLTHLGSMGTLRNEASHMPTTLRFGASRTERIESLGGVARISADVVAVLPEKTTRLLMGGEFTYNELFSIRLGYMSGYETRNVTAGIGLQYEMVRLDYAFVPFRLDFGTTHTFSLGIDF